ncbi:MAG TPA: hypothetical protein VKX49_23405 [Bryobacteraceae bacterium]|nr:hypothetical protein [Bryobacteraceae bacterium]
MSGYRDTYSVMTDDQLLNLALEAESLVSEARSALSVELANRHLGRLDVEEYADHLRRTELIEAQRKPLAQTFNGFGTKLYGKRRPAPDGSFLTTKWVVFFWIPLIPLKSYRVKYAGPGETSFLPGWSRRYLVLSESGPDVGQVVNVYSFIALFVLGGGLLGEVNAGPILSWSALIVWVCIPWLLRRVAGARRRDHQMTGVGKD